MSAPNTLPLEARQAAWERLWRTILLADPPTDEPDDDAAADSDEEAA